MKIDYVSQKEMQKRTGLKKALGYTFPKEETILVRKGLPADLKKEVLAHEEDHLAKGEEGPFPWLAAAAVASAVVGGVAGSKSAGKAADSAEKTAQQQLNFQKDVYEEQREDTAPYREAGQTALTALMGLTGLPGPAPSGPGAGGALSRVGRENLTPLEGITTNKRNVVVGRNRPVYIDQYSGDLYSGSTNEKLERIGNINDAQGEGGSIFGIQAQGKAVMYRDGQFVTGRGQHISDFTVQDAPPTPEAATAGPAGPTPDELLKADPGYQFRLDEGMRALERGASARGGLLSGGFGRKALRYASDYASNEYGKVYDRIANIAGYGMTGAQLSSQNAINFGQMGSQAIGNAGYTRASAYVAQGNQWANAFNEIGKAVGGINFGGIDPGQQDSGAGIYTDALKPRDYGT